MWSKFGLFLILANFFYIYSQDVDAENPIIIWKPIQGATSYQLQIRDDEEKLILEEELKETSYKLNLDPGNYSHRVGTYNKFNKISAYSEWLPFIISRSVPPLVVSEKQIIGSKKDKEKVIRIKGKYFYKNTWLSLKNGEDILPITSMKLNKETYEITIDNDYAKAGNYDLILENPRKKIMVIKNFYILNPDSFFSQRVDAKYPYWKEAIRSTVLPGWGQIRKEQKFKAFFLDFALILSMGNYASALNSFHSDKKKHNQAETNSIIFQTVKGVENISAYGFLQSEAKFNRAESSAENVFNASILFGSIYLINILDALLWKHSVNLGQNSSINLYTNLRFFPVPNSFSNLNSSQIEFGLRVNF